MSEVLRREVGRDLKSAGLSDAEFAVLAGLMRLGGSARPSDCAEVIGWDSSRMAHQLGRLERRGLVNRDPRPGDRRATVVTATPMGRRLHRQAVAPHLRAAKRWFADAIDDTQLQALSEVLAALEINAARQLEEGNGR